MSGGVKPPRSAHACGRPNLSGHRPVLPALDVGLLAEGLGWGPTSSTVISRRGCVREAGSYKDDQGS